MIYLAIAFVIISAIALSFLHKSGKELGKSEEKNEMQDEVLEDVEKANAARNRLRSDPDYANIVRDRFTSP